MIRNTVKNRESKKTLYTILTACLAIGLTIAACEGPAGPQGEQGPRGEQGPQGEQGPKGEEGTANVLYSEWLEIDWNVLDTNTSKAMYIDTPQITEEFLEQGGIILFFVRQADIVYSVPMSRDNTVVYFMATGFTHDLRFIARRISGLSGSINVSWIKEVRYVLIRDGLPAKMPAGFWEDYEAVAEYYGIPD